MFGVSCRNTAKIPYKFTSKVGVWEIYVPKNALLELVDSLNTYIVCGTKRLQEISY
jgi:hypothetical protein